MLLHAAIQEFDRALTGEVTAGTRKLYRYSLSKLLAYFGDIDIAAITTADLRRWREHELEAGLSVYTFHRDIRQLRRFFKWCVEEEIIPTSPAARLKLPKLPDEPPKDISQIDLERMLAYGREFASPRDYAILRFLADSGGRVGGLCSLTFGQLDLEHGEALVIEKGKKARTVHFGAETTRALQAWLIVRPRDKWGDKVFTGQRGPLTPGGIYRILERLAKAAGVEGRYNPHAFRHAFARRLLRHGADMGTVSQLMGHASIEVTHKFYARWTNQELAQRYRELGGALDDSRPRRKVKKDSHVA